MINWEKDIINAIVMVGIVILVGTVLVVHG
jgi:hypothetical protein